MQRLKEAGLTEAELDMLSSPIGLDLGARTPEETAVSIAAEIIAGRWGGGGRPLTEVDGRIHHVPGGQERSDTGVVPGGQERSDTGVVPGGQERSDTGVHQHQHSQLSDSLTRY
jgi:hypothetical protein